MEMKRRFPTEIADSEKILYLTCWGGQEYENDIWFVNNSDETLDYVRPSSGGFATSDDDVIPMTQSRDSVEYRDVKPGEAVKIDTYNIVYDSDFVISFGVDVKCPSLGERHFSSGLEKGSPPEVGLFWKPLPEEIKDPDDPDALIDPGKVAEAYRISSGRSLAANAYFNRGNLMYGGDPGPLKACGLQLVAKSLRDGHQTFYSFLNEEGVEIFQTLDLDRAMEFVRGLKAP